jgi:nitric oxide reductase large subunit
MNATTETPKQGRINWLNVLTVCSAAILIGAEVFGAAFAAGWAFSNLFQLGEYGTHGLQALFFVLGIIVMVRFVLNARRIEPFTRS